MVVREELLTKPLFRKTLLRKYVQCVRIVPKCKNSVRPLIKQQRVQAGPLGAPDAAIYI